MEGKELVLNKHAAGEFFGEVSLLDGEGRSATAVAYEPSRLVHIDRDRLLAFLKQRPDALLRIVQLLCARMRRVTHLVEDLIFLDVSTRLARQIVALTDARVPHHEHAATATLHLSQNDLARMLGVSREFVGKQLTAWRDFGRRRAWPPTAHHSRRQGARTPVRGRAPGPPAGPVRMTSPSVNGFAEGARNSPHPAVGTTAISGGPTMRLFVLSTLTAAAAMAGSMSINPSYRCTGPGALRPRRRIPAAEQKYVGVPCTPTAPKAEAGQSAPCGPVAYSVAEQRYVGIPCTAPTPKAEAGKPAPCGPVAYSAAEQKYVGVPCTH